MPLRCDFKKKKVWHKVDSKPGKLRRKYYMCFTIYATGAVVKLLFLLIFYFHLE